MEKTKKQTRSSYGTVSFIPPLQAFVLHLLCGLGLALAFWVARNVYSVNLIADPAQTLRLIWVPYRLSLCFWVLLKFEFDFDIIFQVIEAPIVILIFSFFRQSPNQCSVMEFSYAVCWSVNYLCPCIYIVGCKFIYLLFFFCVF